MKNWIKENWFKIIIILILIWIAISLMNLSSKSVLDIRIIPKSNLPGL
jgi:hypothetical protein